MDDCSKCVIPPVFQGGEGGDPAWRETPGGLGARRRIVCASVAGANRAYPAMHRAGEGARSDNTSVNHGSGVGRNSGGQAVCCRVLMANACYE